MHPYVRIAIGCGLAGSVMMLAGCGKKAADDRTNIVEMNPDDGSINDLSAIESSTLDQAGDDAASDNRASEGNISNGM